MGYPLHGIIKQYEEVDALRGIDLTIGDEILGIIGYSGVGKTTLLKILAGLEVPTAGILRYNNKRITSENMAYLRKRATMIFQTPLFLRGDVFTNIAYGLRLRRTPEAIIEEQVEKVLETVRLPGLAHRDAGHVLSCALRLCGGPREGCFARCRRRGRFD